MSGVGGRGRATALDPGAIDAVLFDFDDTLYGYAPCNEAGLEAAHAYFLAECVEGGWRWFDGDPEDSSGGRTPDDWNAFRAEHDAVRAELAKELRGQAAAHERSLFFKRLVERGLPLAPLDARIDLTLGALDRYWAAFLERMRPARELEVTLEHLAGRWPLALVSNHTNLAQLRKVRRLGVGRHFRALRTSEELGAEKPAARVFEALLTELDAPAERVLFIGDDPRSDGEGARAAGLPVVLTTEFRGVRDDGSGFECVASLSELRERLA